MSPVGLGAVRGGRLTLRRGRLLVHGLSRRGLLLRGHLLLGRWLVWYRLVRSP